VPMRAKLSCFIRIPSFVIIFGTFNKKNSKYRYPVGGDWIF